MLEIRRATTPADLDEIRGLIGSFIAWLRVLYVEDTSAVDEYFRAIQPELAALPGEYAAPNGVLLMAVDEGRPVGMVALRDLGGKTCEMKRMFVDSTLHGKGVGRALAERLIEEGRGLGYARMRLDTSYRQVAAIGLYRALGFKEVDPYYEVSPEVRSVLLFMELPLQSEREPRIDASLGDAR